ncbi:hypothetical protein F4677DRAFT_419026 [Hypoxylon crocopeplum]|nr:hypothetical protein F4677DRAFT_419026 [Hypoxylon crocopeplum]
MLSDNVFLIKIIPTVLSSKRLHQTCLTNRQMSALSGFCSTFLQALRQNPKFISLVYFCGLHADHDDPDAGPRGMMMSFIAQLIVQWGFDTSFPQERADLSWVEYGEEPYIDDLCALVNWLICQLPASMTVFCVIDGISAYENESYVQDLVEGLACVLDLVIDAQIRLTVKVLVTSPCRTFEVREGFHDDVVLAMAGQSGVSRQASQRQLQYKVSRVFGDN